MVWKNKQKNRHDTIVPVPVSSDGVVTQEKMRKKKEKRGCGSIVYGI